MISGFTIRTFKEFAPDDISGLVAWYDATTLTGADGSSLNQWLDSSGNEAHMFQITSAAQPTLQTAELNGRNVVRFDGVDDFFNMTAPFNFLPSASNNENVNKFSRTGAYLVHFSGNTSPRLTIYKKSGNIFNKLADPAILPSTAATSGTWTSDDIYLAVGSTGSPFFRVYKRAGDTFTALSVPAVLPSNFAAGLDFSNNDTYLALSGSMTGLMLVYKRAGDTFTSLANPVTVPAGTLANAIKFSKSDNYLAVGSNASPFIQFYSRSGDTFTKLNNPANLPTALVRSISWLSDTVCAVGGNEATVSIYQYNSGTNQFDRINTITTAGTVTTLDYSASGNFLSIGQGASPFLSVYSHSSNVYTNITTIDRIPQSSIRGSSFNPTSDMLSVSCASSPFLNMYSISGSTFTNMNRLNLLRNVAGASMFVVIKYPNTGIEQTAYFISNSLSSASYRLTTWVTNLNFYQIARRTLDADSPVAVTSSVSGIAGFIIHAGLINYTIPETRQYINGALQPINTTGTGANTSDTDSLVANIGRYPAGSRYINGDIAEILLFNRKLNDFELADIHNYLSVKWGISI